MEGAHSRLSNTDIQGADLDRLLLENVVDKPQYWLLVEDGEDCASLAVHHRQATYLVLQQYSAGVDQPGLQSQVEKLPGGYKVEQSSSVSGYSLLPTVDNVLPILQRLSEDLHGDLRTFVVLLENSAERLSIKSPPLLFVIPDEVRDG